MSWMDSQIDSDVNTAIQSQVIQTALERNTTGLTDTGYQSFLNGAPIPRAYYDFLAVNPLGGAAQTVLSWQRAGNMFDPYGLLDTGTNTSYQVPRDGFYTLSAGVFGTSGGAGGLINYILLQKNTASIAAQTIPPTGNDYYATVAWNGWLVAGDLIRIVYRNNPATGLTVAGAHFGITWDAPYKQYTGGSQ